MRATEDKYLKYNRVLCSVELERNRVPTLTTARSKIATLRMIKMPANLESIITGVIQGNPVLNWSKAGTLAAFWILAIRAHTQRHFLKKDELKEGTALHNLADSMPHFICLGGCIIVGTGYLTKQEPLHGRWTLDEGIALGIAASALFLRLWAIRSLKHFFTYKVGIREGHR